MDIDNATKETSGSPSNEAGGNVPSGFILKLYQMVNGAPDEVISWTPAGDAFIIGSNLNRLETETLPQYFRHNRFQSLVRQINRERNVWIYKHKLFHRDRPEDLHMVRRRTCPGVDGRKQRFSRFSAQKLSKFDDEDKGDQTSDDETSMDETSGEENDPVVKKRRGSMSDRENVQASSKRPRRVWQVDGIEKGVEVDTSILSDPVVAHSKVLEAPTSLTDEVEANDESSANKKDERTEMIERSMIVSEVAMKLEEHARKAMKGRGSSRTRRGSGVVTPPWGSSQTALGSARGLITYDDEYNDDANTLSGVVTDGDDSLNSEDGSVSGANNSSKDLFEAPVSNTEEVQHIVSEIRKRASGNFYNSEMIHACAGVAEVLMTTPPGEDIGSCCNKVVELLNSSERLAADFHSYRAALNPEISGGSGLSASFGNERAMSLRRVLEGGSGRHDALREFKTFAVNMIYKLLGKNGNFDVQPFNHTEFSNLLNTAEAWSKSLGMVA